MVVTDFIWLFSFILGGLLIGYLFEKIILTQLIKMTMKNKWDGDEIIVGSLKGIAKWAFFVAGLYGASLSLKQYIGLEYISIFQKILQIVTIFLATGFVSRFSVGLIRLYNQKDSGILPSVSIFTNLVRIIVFLIGILIALQALNISITPILTALGVGGLAVALALQDTLSNLFSGLYIIASRQIKPNDYVKLNSGEEGYIIDISWRSTTIRALANNLIIVPNATLAGAIITNFQKPSKEISVPVDVSVSYDSNLEHVETITLEVAQEILREIPGAVKDFKPAVRFKSFGEAGIQFSISLRAREFVDQFLLRHEFIKRLHARYQTEGIEIPYKAQMIYVHGKNDKV